MQMCISLYIVRIISSLCQVDLYELEEMEVSDNPVSLQEFVS